MLFGKKKKEPPFVTAIVPAAGASRRMGGENKLLMELCGIPVLARTLLVLEVCPSIREIVVAAAPDQLERYGEMIAAFDIKKAVKVVCGGETRGESVYRAALEADPQAKYLAVHDGDRPLVTREVVERACEAAFAHTAAAPGVPIHDTVKEVDKKDFVVRTVEREPLRAMQTPQVADRALLLAALQKALESKLPFTDECSALELMGVRPAVTPGSFENIKITTPIDLLLAQAILEGRAKR